MTLWEAKLLKGEMEEALWVNPYPYTPKETYNGPPRRPTRYPRPKGVKSKKDGYQCLNERSTT